MGKRGAIIYEKRMGIGELTELLSIYDHQCEHYHWEDEHEKLLWAHIIDMRFRLNHMKDNIDRTVKLGLCLSEAAAFYQLWNTVDTSSWPLATVIIGDMVERIDKAGHFPAIRIKKAYKIN